MRMSAMTVGDVLDEAFSAARRLTLKDRHRARALNEAELQQPAPAAIPAASKLPAEPQAAAAAPVQGETQSPATSKDKETLKSGDVELNDVIEKLNAIRAGKSFRDEQIEAELSTYFESLSVAERTALYAYLTGIQEIVSGVSSAQAAMDPSDPEPAVKMEKQNTAKKVSVKPNVVKKATPAPTAQPTQAPTAQPAQSGLPIKPVAK